MVVLAQTHISERNINIRPSMQIAKGAVLDTVALLLYPYINMRNSAINNKYCSIEICLSSEKANVETPANRRNKNTSTDILIGILNEIFDPGKRLTRYSIHGDNMYGHMRKIELKVKPVPSIKAGIIMMADRITASIFASTYDTTIASC